MIIFLVGFMGSGKTTMGKWAARKAGLDFADLDDLIEGEAGLDISQLFDRYGEDEFRKLERKALEAVIAQKENLLLSCGGGTPCFFDNMDLMNRSGLTVYLEISPKRLAGRLKRAKTERPLLRQAGSDLAGFVGRILERRQPYYSQARIILREDEANKQRLWETIAGILGEAHQ